MAAPGQHKRRRDEGVYIAGERVPHEVAEQFSAEHLKALRRGWRSLTAGEKGLVGQSLLKIAKAGVGTGTGESLKTAAKALRLARWVMHDLTRQADELDDLTWLRKCLDGGLELGVIGNPLHGKAVKVPVIDVLASLEEKTASIRGNARPRQAVTKELYGRLTDEVYITPVVTEAVKQLIGHGLMETPYPVGSVRYVRKARNIHQPVSMDEGCYLVFHLPVSDGTVRPDLPAEERDMRRRIAVAVEFDRDGKAVSVRRFDVKGGRKLYTPVNAYIDVVPAITEGETGGAGDYYYWRLAFEPVGLGRGALSRIVGELEGKANEVGVTQTEDGGRVVTYQLRDGQEVRGGGDAVWKGGDRIGIVHDRSESVRGVVRVVERQCVQAEVGGVRFGISVEPEDVGVPLRETEGRLINELASGIVRQRRRERRGSDNFNEARGEATAVLKELADGVPPLRVSGGDEVRMSREMFLRESRHMIPYLIELRRSIADAAPGSIPDELRGFNYAKLYQTAALMVAGGRALNLSWGPGGLSNFLQGYAELKEQELRNRSIEEAYGQQTDRVIEAIRREHMKTNWFIQEQAERTRRVVREAKHLVSEKIDRIPHAEKVASEMLEAFGDMRDGLVGRDAGLAEKLDAIALDLKGGSTKVRIQAGLNLGLVSVGLSREIEAGGLGDKVRAGYRKLKAAFGSVAEAVGVAGLTGGQAEVLASFKDLYMIQ